MCSNSHHESPSHSRSLLSRLSTPLLVGLTAATLFEGCRLESHLPRTSDAGSHDLSTLTFSTKSARPLPVQYQVVSPSGVTNRLTIGTENYLHYRGAKAPRVIPSGKAERTACGFLTPQEPIIREFATKITDGIKEDGAKANKLLHWVRENISYDYVELKNGKDYSRFPVETLFEKRGDGEDVSYLYLSLCHAVGIEGTLVHYSNHIATAVNVPGIQGAYFNFRGKQFQFAEPSAAISLPASLTNLVGVIPNQFDNQGCYIYGPHINAEITGRDIAGNQWKFTIPARQIEAQRSYQGRRGAFALGDPAQANFVTPHDPCIKQIAETLTKGATTERQKAGCLLHFVRSNIEYDFNEASSKRDYFRFPLETIASRLGDCEDKSILYASLCKAAGLDTALVRLPGHMVAGVAIKSGDSGGNGYTINNTFYSFVETTGISPSQIPKTAQAESHTGLPIGNPGIFSNATAHVFVIK